MIYTYLLESHPSPKFPNLTVINDHLNIRSILNIINNIK